MSRRGPAGAHGVAALLAALLLVGLLVGPAVGVAPAPALFPVPARAFAAEPAVPPRPTGEGARPIVDQAGVLTPEQEARLDATLGRLYRTTGITAGVLTVRSIAPETIEGYTQRVFDAWRLGRAGKDDGLLLVVAVEDRRVRLQPGYAIEPILPDGRIGELVDRYAVPAFRAGHYGEGIAAVMEAAAAILANEAPPEPPRAPGGSGSAGFNPAWLILLFVLAIALSRLLGGRGGPRGPRRGLHDGGPRGRYGGPIIIPGGFGGFGGGASGGGWGGFGGGSGGGGASRGW